MNNKLRHVVIFFFDILGLWLVWAGYDSINQTLVEINNQVDIISFGNRVGFHIVGIGIPLMHLLIVVEQLWPDFIHKFEKYKKPVNNCIMGFVVGLLIVGFALSSWLQTRAKNAGYVYCRYISGTSALAKTLVYTNGAKLCEDLSAKARAERLGTQKAPSYPLSLGH